MPTFLVEVYAPHSARPGELEAAARAAPQAANGVRYVESIFVPEDETCFHLFDGPSAETVCEAARRSAHVVERISRANRPGSSPRRGDRAKGAAMKQPGKECVL